MRGDARRWPVREERLNCTHVIVSLLKAWKVTVVWIECHDRLLTTFQDGTHHKLLAQENYLNSASKVANWNIVDILKYLY